MVNSEHDESGVTLVGGAQDFVGSNACFDVKFWLAPVHGVRRQKVRESFHRDLVQM